MKQFWKGRRAFIMRSDGKYKKGIYFFLFISRFLKELNFLKRIWSFLNIFSNIYIFGSHKHLFILFLIFDFFFNPLIGSLENRMRMCSISCISIGHESRNSMVLMSMPVSFLLNQNHTNFGIERCLT